MRTEEHGRADHATEAAAHPAVGADEATVLQAAPATRQACERAIIHLAAYRARRQAHPTAAPAPPTVTLAPKPGVSAAGP
jgi:hypothetical protein